MTCKRQQPTTPAHVLGCMVPYRYLNPLTGPEVVALKRWFDHDVGVFLGADFGSGRTDASKTVVSILVKFMARPDRNFNTPRYLVADIYDSAPTDDDEKARWIADLIRQYGVDGGVADLGYGEHIVAKVQKGGFSATGEPWKGVGTRYLKGCWTRQDPVGVRLDKKLAVDDEGKRPSHLLIDKTHSIQTFIDLVKRRIVHPYHRDLEWGSGEPHINNSNLKYARSQLIIPYGVQRKMDWLVHEFTSISRKDLGEDDMRKPDGRQSARLEFNHPPDAVMSIVYALLAAEKFDPDAYKIIPVNRRY